jgi:phage minor structural protein
MIRVFKRDAGDFSTNGLGTVEATSCVVSEILNGMYELELTCDLDAYGKWGYLALDNIVVAPVPAGTTPMVTMPEHVDTPTSTAIYRVTGGTVNFRKGPGMSYKIIKVLRRDALVTLVNKNNANWYKIIDKSGTTGYMWHEYLTLHKTEPSTPIGDSETASIDPHVVRDQPFRIYDIIPSLSEITVRARHLFYDLADNMILSATFKKIAGNVAGPQLFAACESEHDFDFYTNITQKKSAEFAEVSPVEALLGEEGFVDTWGGELMRDWYEVFVMKKLGKNRNVTVRYGKNLLTLGGSQNNANAVSRIIPVGQDKDGKPLYLPEKHVESEHAANFVHPRYAVLKVADAKEHENKKNPNDKDNPTVTKAQCYDMMREAALEEFENGADLMDLSLTIDFVMPENTVEYRDFKHLRDIFLGDTVKVIVERVGLEIFLRMTEYKFNCLTRRYESITLGQAAGNAATGISPRQLPNGRISGIKLGYGSVNGGAIQDGAVGSLQIGLASIMSAHIEDAQIVYAHINSATIDELKAGSITAVTAYIQNLVAGNITTDELYAALAVIAKAQITEANIETANINWANIETLVAQMAHIALANINTANIKTANIDWASIATLMTEVAHIAVANLTTANIMNASITWADIFNANIDWATINNLTAEIATISKAQITTANIINANIAWASITSLQTAVADLTQASIGTADISYAQIKDLVANTAIITEGLSGQLYIDRLYVTEANMVSLTTGELIVRGEDGKFYTFKVDEHGELQIEEQLVEGDNIANNSLDASTKIIERSITAELLNVSQIFAHNAMIIAVKAANIDVADLFASNAYVGALHTNIINSNVGASLDISSNAAIQLLVADYEDLSDRLESATFSVTPQAIIAVVVNSSEFKAEQTRITQNASAITLKADATVTNGLDTRLTSAETKITPTAIVSTVRDSAAYKGDINGLQAGIASAETKITQNVNAIALKADKTVTDGLNTRLTTAETKITPAAIVSTVTDSQAYKDDVGGLKTRMTSAESKITATAIVATVTASQI